MRQVLYKLKRSQEAMMEYLLTEIAIFSGLLELLKFKHPPLHLKTPHLSAIADSLYHIHSASKNAQSKPLLIDLPDLQPHTFTKENALAVKSNLLKWKLTQEKDAPDRDYKIEFGLMQWQRKPYFKVTVTLQWFKALQTWSWLVVYFDAYCFFSNKDDS